jgi:hypothetical protein
LARSVNECERPLPTCSSHLFLAAASVSGDNPNGRFDSRRLATSDDWHANSGVVMIELLG